MNDSYKKAADTLKEHRNILDEIANVLMGKETIESDEFNDIILRHGIKPKRENPEKVHA